MKRILIPFILAAFIHAGVAAETIQLTRTDYYPRNDDDYFFRALPDMAIVDDYLLVTEIFDHKVLMFSVKNGIEFLKKIGRQGQGPGEFSRPYRISVWDDEIAVKDQKGYSFFDTKGKYKKGFALTAYGSGSYCLFAHGKIYSVNQKIEDSQLIDVYSSDGNKVSGFGSKYLEIDGSKYQGFGPFGVGGEVYEGNLLCEGGIIFYVNFKFGDVRKFNLKGELLLATNFCSLFGEHGRKTFQFNKATFIDKGVKLAETNGRIPALKVIMDAYLQSGILYLLEYNFTPGVNKEKEDIRIMALDIDTFHAEAQYVFNIHEVNRVICFSVAKPQGKPVFYIHMETDDYVIAEYQVKE